MKRMLCWMKISDAHGRVGYDPIWLPEGDEPETDRKKYERAPWLDEPKKEDPKTQSEPIKGEEECQNI